MPTSAMRWPRWTRWPVLHQQLRGVGELGDDAVAVVDRDGVAVARFPAGIGHDARGGGLDRAAHRRRHVDALVRPGDVQDRVLAHGRERAREPALGRHDRRRGGQPLRVAGQAVLGLLERRGQQVGPADQRVQVDPDLLGAPQRRSGVRQPRRAASVGPPMPAAWTWGSIGSRLARTRMRASRWLMRVRVSDRVARRPCSSPISWASRGFSSCRGARAGQVRRAGHGRVPDEQRRRPAEGRAADRRLDQAVGDLDDLRGLRAVWYEDNGPPAFRHALPSPDSEFTVLLPNFDLRPIGSPTDNLSVTRQSEVTRHTESKQKCGPRPRSCQGR